MLEECTTGSNLSRKATLLMAEVMQMANRVLPLNVAAKIQVRFGISFIFWDFEYVVGRSARVQSGSRLQPRRA